jgi:hypothetical protein
MNERTYTADEVDAMIARAVIAAQPAPVQKSDDLRLHQWTANEKDLSDYICVGSLTLAGIEDGEYGESEIDSLQNTIEALQERLVTGYEHKKVPLLAYIGGLNTTPPKRPWVGLTDEEIREIHSASRGQDVGVATGLIEAKLKERNHGT